MRRAWLAVVTTLGISLLLPQAVLALTPLPSDEHLTSTFREADANGDGKLRRD